MEASNVIARRLGQRLAPRHISAARRPPFVALWLVASMAMPCLAAEGMNGLGAAFRPQAAATSPIAAGGERGNSDAQGLRVIVSGTTGTVASIDGRTVHVGDMVNEMRVTQINLQGVVLTAEDGTEERLTITPVVKRMLPTNPKRASNGASR